MPAVNFFMSSPIAITGSNLKEVDLIPFSGRNLLPSSMFKTRYKDKVPSGLSSFFNSSKDNCLSSGLFSITSSIPVNLANSSPPFFPAMPLICAKTFVESSFVNFFTSFPALIAPPSFISGTSAFVLVVFSSISIKIPAAKGTGIANLSAIEIILGSKIT